MIDCQLSTSANEEIIDIYRPTITDDIQYNIPRTNATPHQDHSDKSSSDVGARQQ